MACCALAVAASPRPAAAQSAAELPVHKAEPVARFLDSLGINTHVAQGYSPAPYVDALKYLGVRNIRDSTAKLASLIDLHRKTGVLVDIQNGGDLKGLLDAGKALAGAGALLSLEGPNEPNNFPITYNGHVGGGSKSWLAVAEFQRDLYRSAKSDPVLARYPVLHVSEGGAEVDNVGMQFLTIPALATTSLPPGTKFADYANPHNYITSNCRTYVDNQAWQAADPSLKGCWDGMFGEYGHTWRKGYAGYSREQLASVPRVTTETGWDSAAGGGGEALQGKLLVNTYLAQFARGWRYTFVYELGEGEGGNDHFGVFHKDWTPKLAATYIHTLTAILGGEQDAGAKTGPHGSLSYAIRDQPPTVHDLLLAGPGVLSLVVWGERAHGGSDVVIKLGRFYDEVRVYDVTSGTRPTLRLADVDTLVLRLEDHALVIEIPQGAGLPPAKDPDSPS